MKYLLTFFMLISVPVAAQICLERDGLLKSLDKNYQEAPKALGVTSSGQVIELLTSEGGSTWTIIVTSPNGLSCLVAAGDHWETIERLSSTGPGA